MYVILGMLYENYIHPLTILSTLPSAGVGALLALWAAAFRDTYPDGAYPRTLDELTHLQRFKLFQNLAVSSFTFRHGINDQAVPYRQIGAFRPGDGVGGAGLHSSGQHWRVLPEELALECHLPDHGDDPDLLRRRQEDQSLHRRRRQRRGGR